MRERTEREQREIVIEKEREIYIFMYINIYIEREKEITRERKIEECKIWQFLTVTSCAAWKCVYPKTKE